MSRPPPPRPAPDADATTFRRRAADVGVGLQRLRFSNLERYRASLEVSAFAGEPAKLHLPDDHAAR